MLENPTQRNSQLLMSDEKLKLIAENALEKLIFFFGDSISLDDRYMFAGDEGWLYEVGGEALFLPPIPKSYSLASL